MYDKETKLLDEIKKQIERFDIKASILMAISGVLLGMSFGWMPIFKEIEYSSIKITTYFLFFFTILYILFLFFAITIFIWAIFPRSRPKELDKNKTNNSSLYYKDLQKMKISNIKKEVSKNKKTCLCLSEQIKINSIIANKKHKLLNWGILFLILSILSIITSVLLYMFI